MSVCSGAMLCRSPALTLSASAKSRAMRCLWLLEEIGEPYQLIEKSTRPEDLQSADYLRLNPNARIPTLVDRDVVLWESMAINLYLAQEYKGPMHCAGPQALGLAAQWSFWAMLETALRGAVGSVTSASIREPHPPVPANRTNALLRAEPRRSENQLPRGHLSPGWSSR